MKHSADDYIGDPGYPAPWTTSMPREGLRDTDEARIISLAPDVCRSPKVPVPYPVVEFCGHDESYTPSVRFTGQRAMVMRSHADHVHGGEAGIGKGVKSNTVGGIAEPITHADQVRAEGSHVIRHLDRFYMNNRNTVGEAIFVRDTRTFKPPKDDDPLPGSLRLADNWAQSQPSEATPSAAQSAVAVTNPAAVGTIGGAITLSPGGAIASGAGEATLLGELAAGARLALRRLGWLGIAYTGYELGQQENQRAWNAPEDYMEQEALRYGGVDSFDSRQMEIYDEAVERLRGGAAQGHVRGDFYQQMDSYRRQLETAILLGSAARVADSVRVDEDAKRPRCKTKPICFMPRSPDIDHVEFYRQLKLQERALNAMTPGEMLGNRGAYLANPEGIRKLSEPLQERTRNEYYRSRFPDFRRIYGPRARAELDAHMKTVAALHNPDMIAGGAYTSVADPSIPLQDRIGGTRENSSMGAQWQGGRSRRLADHALEQQRNGCPSVQVVLEICED